MSTEFNRHKLADRSDAERSEAESDTELESGAERASSQLQARATSERERPAPERPEPESSETPYLPEQDSGPANERWQRIQTAFVDDPRKSVTEAHQLVGELTQRIVDAFAHERDELEKQWSEGSDVSTEDLRVSLQRYRAFFSRLLPSMKQLTSEEHLAAE
jgi:hypothetical protein